MCETAVVVNGRPRARRRAGAGLASALALAFLAPAALALGGGSRDRLASLVPGDAYLYASFEGFDACEKAAANLDLAELWAEPEMQAFVKDALAMMRGHVSQMEQGNGIPFGEIRSLLSGPIAIAAGDLTLIDPPDMKHGGGPPMMPVPGVLVALAAGEHRQKIDEYIRQGLSAAGSEVVRGSYEYKGRRVETIAPPGSRFMSICWTWADDVLLVGLNKYFIQRALDCQSSSGRGSLAQAPGYARSSSKVAGDDVAHLYLNIDGLRAKVAPLLPPEVGEIADLFGIGTVGGLYLGLKTEGAVGKGVLYVDAPGEKAGLLRILAPGASPMNGLEYAPSESAFFMTVKIDPIGAFREIEKLAAFVEPRAVEELHRGLAEVNREAGFDVLGDLAASLDGEISIFAWTPPGGGMIPSAALLVGLTDREKFESLFTRVLSERARGVEAKSMPFEGSEIRYFQIPGVPVVPSYLMTDEGLLLASAPNIVKDLVQRRKRGDATLASNPDFAAARKSMVKGGSVFQYADLRPLVAMAYNMASMALPGLASQMGHVPVDFALLPTTETFTRHLSPSLVGYVADKDGLLIETRGPLTLGALVPLAAAALEEFDRVRIGPALFQGMGVRREVVRTSAPEPVRAEDGGAFDSAAPDASDAFARGVSLARSQRNEEALAQFDAALAANPRHGDAAFNRAMALHNLRRLPEAIAGFERAKALGQDEAICEYNIACGYSLQGNADPAFEHLARALEIGFSRLELLSTDGDLDNIRQDPRFKKLTQRRAQ